MVVLGVSPGTRYMGIAILCDRKLVKWKLCSFPKKWTPQKLKTIVSSFENYISKSNTKVIAIKVPDTLPLSKAYIQLVGTINALCESKNIKPVYYTLNDLKIRYCGTQSVNKEWLAQTITLQNPELEKYLNKKNDTGKLHYEKIFEAVAVCHALQNEV